MSEEEIINNLQGLLILNTYLDLNDATREYYQIPRKTLKEWFENSKLLLDLYKKEKEELDKEKEKNNKLIKTLYEMQKLLEE